MKKVWKYLALIKKVRVQVIEMTNINGEVRRDFLVDKNKFWSDLWISFVCHNAEHVLFWTGFNNCSVIIQTSYVLQQFQCSTSV